jgi:predicted transcriptional regulator
MPRPGRPRNTARDEKIIARAGAGEEPASIAADLGLTPERVRKIVRKAR